MAFYKLNEIQGKGRRVVDTVTDDIREARLFGGKSLGATDKRGFSGYYNLDTQRAGAYRNISAQPLSFAQVIYEFHDLLTANADTFDYVLAQNVLEDEAQRFFEQAPRNHETYQNLVGYIRGEVSLHEIDVVSEDDTDDVSSVVLEQLKKITAPQVLFEINKGSRKVFGICEYYDRQLVFTVKDTINMGGLLKNAKEAVRDFRENNAPVTFLAEEIDEAEVSELGKIPLDEIFDVDDVKSDAEDFLQYLDDNSIDYQKARTEVAEITGFSLSVLPMNKTSQGLYAKYLDNEISAIDVIRALGVEEQSIKAIKRKIESIDPNELAHRYVEEHFNKGFVSITQGKEMLVNAGQRAIEEMVAKLNNNNIFEYQGTAEYPNVLVRELVRDMTSFVNDDEIQFDEIDESIAKIQEVLENFDGYKLDYGTTVYTIKIKEVSYINEMFGVKFSVGKIDGGVLTPIGSPATVRQYFINHVLDKLAEHGGDNLTEEDYKVRLYHAFLAEVNSHFRVQLGVTYIERNVENAFQQKHDMVQQVLNDEIPYDTFEQSVMPQFRSDLKNAMYDLAVAFGAKKLVNEDGVGGDQFFIKTPLEAFHGFLLDDNLTGFRELGFTEKTSEHEDDTSEIIGNLDNIEYAFPDFTITVDKSGDTVYEVNVTIKPELKELVVHVHDKLGEFPADAKTHTVNGNFAMVKKYVNDLAEEIIAYIKDIKKFLIDNFEEWFEMKTGTFADYVLSSYNVNRIEAYEIVRKAMPAIKEAYQVYVNDTEKSVPNLFEKYYRLHQHSLRIYGIEQALNKYAEMGQ